MKSRLFILLGLCASTALANWAFEPVPVNTNAGEPNPHWNSGGRRMVRIHNQTLVLAPTSGGGEKIWRSTNSGASWNEIDADGAYSGSLISGPDSMVYHFYIDRGAGGINMVRFKYNAEVIPAPIVVYSNTALCSSQVISEYQSLNATVDSSGTLYVATHWGATADAIYVFASKDDGMTWSQPVRVDADTRNWFYPQMEVDAANRIHMTYQQHNGSGNYILLASSADQGKTWSNKTISQRIGSTFHANPSLLTAGSDTLWIFVQGESPNGLLVTRSTDAGKTFSAFTLIEPTCGYGDPSAALGADGKIYVAFRSSRNTGASGGCGDMSREKVAVSADGGGTWNAVDSLYNASRTGTRSQMRYQTWWNYGGPLEWIWMQYHSSSQPIYYDRNIDIPIASRNSLPGLPVGLKANKASHAKAGGQIRDFPGAAKLKFRRIEDSRITIEIHDCNGRQVRGPLP